MNKKDIYFLADLHITADPPECRLETPEEYFQMETEMIQQVKKIVGNDLLVIAGDIIDTWKPKNSQEILNMLSDNLPKNTVWTMGNHEVFGCSQDRDKALKEGTFGTMTRMKGLTYITEPYEWGNFVLYPHDFRYGRTLDHNEVDSNKTNIAISHFMSFPKTLPHWAKPDNSWLAKDVLAEFPEYDLTVVGDYHVPFTIGNQYLSPGSLLRRTIHQVEYTPAIWKYDGEILELIYFNITPADECMTNEHIVKKSERTSRMDDWGEDLKQEQELTGNFKEDVKMHFLDNDVIKPVMEMMNTMIVEVEME